MTGITIEDLGLSKAELADRVVERAADVLLRRYTVATDEDGEEIVDETETQFMRQMQERIKTKIDEAVDQIAAANVLPNVASYVENLCLQETNKWGEKRGKAMTFTEYLVAKAEAYLTEEVDFEGSGKSQSGRHYWKPAQTRVAHLVHRHLHYEIEKAMKAALETATSSIATGLHETVRLKLEEAAAQLKVDVKTK